MYRTRRMWLIITAMVLTLALGFSFFVSFGGVGADADYSSDNIRTLLEVISLLKTQYYKDVDALRLIAKYVEHGTINGMLKEGLEDPYTRHVEGRAWEQMQIDTHGLYGGIGITVGMQDDQLTIVAIFEDTPGFEAGLRPGDKIVAIEDRPTDFMSLDEAVSLMRGHENTAVTLEIDRSGDRFTAHIVRAVIEVPSVSTVETFPVGTFPQQNHTFGYIRLQRFSEISDRQMDEALTALTADGVSGVILDLRDNPGGLLNAAIDVANRFLPEGHPIVHVVTGKGEQRRTFYSSKFGTHPRIPLVVLINEYSASASEILSGALQDRGFAKLVGKTTFGKGSVQLVVTLRDGSALTLTQARYETANGHDINDVGVAPDVEIDWVWDEDNAEDLFFVIGEALDSDPQFLKAVEVLMDEIGPVELKKAG